MTSTTYDQLTDSVAGVLDDLDMLEAIAEAATVGELDKGPERKWARKYHELEPTADVWEALDTIALEVYATARIDSGGGIDIQSVTIVTGTGGPHIEATIDDQGRAVSNGWWGSDWVDRARSGFDRLAGVLFDYFEEVRG